MARPSVRDTDRGMKRIVKLLGREARRARVDVGWFKEAQHEGGVQTATIASVHEFGAPEHSIPARPMLSRTVDENRAKFREQYRDAWARAIDGRERIESALLRYGQDVRTAIIRTITRGPHTPLAPATIARKGSSKPLIDTGAMRDQVDVRVGLGNLGT